MLGRGVAAWLGGDWGSAFSEVRPWLAEADLAVANLESPLTHSPFAGGRFDLRAPPESVHALTAAGFDVLSLANNHALDGGPGGLEEARETLEGVGISALIEPRVEVSAAQEAGGVQRVTVNGVKIALLGFLDDGGDWDTDFVTQAATATDLVIVQVHWGAEYYPLVTDRQRELAAALVAGGADLVIGHGPHVLQPLEWLDGAPVAYSLGNLLFDQPFDDTRRGAILVVTLVENRIGGVTAVPTVIDQGRVRRAGPDQAPAILGQLGLADSTGASP
jgi:poly-gamma-glutamate synthesis protein (capsule biosynthesis protein)